jgi:uncharacterized integral membrane protein
MRNYRTIPGAGLDLQSGLVRRRSIAARCGGNARRSDMIRAMIVIPVLLVLVVFAASNPTPVTLALWPTQWSFSAPLSVATLAIATVFFVAGAFLVWVPAQATRLRAGFAGRRVGKLEAQVAKLQGQLSAKKA